MYTFYSTENLQRQDSWWRGTGEIPLCQTQGISALETNYISHTSLYLILSYINLGKWDGDHTKESQIKGILLG